MKLQRHGPFADVVIVAVDDEAFATLGQRQPLPREYLARIVRGLARSGAAVVGLDVSLSTMTEDDEALATAMKEFSDAGLTRVVTVTGSPPGGPLADIGLVARTVSGFPEVEVDSDGVVRRAGLTTRRGLHIDPGLALAVVARLRGVDRRMLGNILHQPGDQLDLPVWRQGDKWEGATAPLVVVPDTLWRINFLGHAGTFLSIPSEAIAALADPSVEVAAENPVRGRIVLVGGTFRESRDFYMTPLGRLSGVEIHANLVHTLGTRSFIRPASWIVSLGLQIALVALAGILLVFLKPFMGTVVVLGGVVLIGLPASFLVFARAQHWIDFMLPIFAMRVMAWGVDFLDRDDVREALARWSPFLARKMARHAVPLHGERREVSLLLAVLRDFGREADKMAVEEIAALLDTYREIVRQTVSRYNGTVHAGFDEKILAVFGCPGPPTDHVMCAARAAMAIAQRVRDIKTMRGEAGETVLRVGIVIHSGVVFAGRVGGAGQYGFIGSAIDLVGGLDRANDDLDSSVLMTSDPRVTLGDRAAVSDRGAVSLRGRQGEEIRLWELINVRKAGARG
jgi:CHASE2 domain-containing sensor protein/class 3 adenylate cyclase